MGESMYKKRIKEIDLLKQEIDKYRPLKQRQLEQLQEYYRIGLTYTSNALEGNSLTETETKIVLEEGITIGGKLIRDHLEAIGHSDAYTYLLTCAQHVSITEKDILQLHNLFYYRIDPHHAGSYRQEQVFITGTEFIPPAAKQVPNLMKKLITEIPSLAHGCHPVEYAALIHLKLVTIHPFIDGNGRCARLLMNLVLLQQGYVITIIQPIMRREYIGALQRAQVKKDDTAFVNFIVNMAYESHQDYLRLLKAQE